MDSQREHAQQLLGHLAPDQIAAVVHLMDVMLDPLSRKLANAPPEDEVISSEEDAAVAEARDWGKQNEALAHENVLAELGLTLADFDQMAQTPLRDESEVRPQ